MEVACEPGRIDVRSYALRIAIETLIIWMQISFCSIMFVAAGYMSGNQFLSIVLPYSFLILVVCGLLAHAIAYYSQGKKRKALARFARLFSAFTHIETLVLHDFKGQEAVFEALKRTLKGVHIYRLEVRETSVDDQYWFVISRKTVSNCEYLKACDL